MEKVNSTYFYNIFLNKKNQFIEIEWINKSDNIIEEITEEMIQTVGKTISETGYNKLLINLIKSQYILTRSNYKWYYDTIFSGFNDLNIAKIAYVVPENLFVHISFIAANFSMASVNQDIQYFKGYVKAIEWLKQS